MENTKTLSEETRGKLRKPFPAEAISKHPTKSFLSTIKAIYIVERLNDVFGIGGWTINHKIISDEKDYVAVSGYIKIKEPYNFKTPVQYGGHKKTGKNTEPADGYKSAVTDCQSKCASYLEIGIDVFKGLVVPPGGNKKNPAGNKSSKEMSVAQWNFIKNIATKTHEMTEDELVTMIKWLAEKEKLTPKHWKISKLLLPEAEFEKVFIEYSEYLLEHPEEKQEPDF